MTAFIDTALTKAMDMSDTAFIQVFGTPTATMQTVLNYLFHPGVLRIMLPDSEHVSLCNACLYMS
jgi:hypothetical protein